MRSLLRSRGFAAAVILILGVAIALQASMVAVVNAYLVRSLPYPEAERLYSINYAQPPEWPRGLEEANWASLSDVIEHPIAWDLDMFYLLGGEYPEAAPGAWVTWGFLEGLGIRAAIGRSFGEGDFVTGAPQVAIISAALWRDRYGADPNVVGRTFNAYVSDRPDDPETFTIVGVLPEGFWHLNPYTQVLTPLRANTYPYMARLREGVPPALVERRIDQMARATNITLPTSWSPTLRLTHGEYTRAARPMLFAVGGAVTLVFLIAAANVALLTVLRGMRRRKEIAVRLALGASVPRLARLLLGESLALVGLATTFGLALSWWVLRTFGPQIEMQLGRRVPGGTSAMALDWRVLAIVAGAALVVALILSLAPLVSGRAIFSALRERRMASRHGGRRTRSALIALEVGGSLALLAGCGLMVRTVVQLLDVPMNMRVDGLMMATLSLRQQSYPDPARRAQLYDRMLGTLRASNSTSAAVLSGPSPLASYNPEELTATTDSGQVKTRAAVRLVSDGYFGLLSIPMAAGRPVDATDRPTSQPVVVVSETLARRLWGNVSAIGRTLRLVERPNQRDSVIVMRTVVGVARDVRQSPSDEELADAYVPLLQNAGRFAAIVTRGDARIATDLRRIVRTVDDEIALSAPQDQGEALSRQLARPRFLVGLFTAFGAFAAMLGAIGLYVVIASAVKQREHEIAVRLAVGATGGNIRGMVLRDGSWVLGVGILLGVAGALGIGRLLRSQLFGVRPMDPLAIGVACAALALVSLVAMWWPARRASRTDPVMALKSE